MVSEIKVAVFIGIIGWCAVGIMLVSNLVPVQAATPDVPSCEAINSAGNLMIYRCLPAEGLPYLVNSNGFMMLEN